MRSRVGFGFALEVSPAKIRAPVTGVDEQSIRQRGRPRGLRHPQRAPEDADRFRRHARGIDTGGRGARAGSTERLLIPEDADLVAPGHLPRDTRAGVLEEAVRVRSSGSRRVHTTTSPGPRR